MLVVKGTGIVDRSSNAYDVLYPTLIGAYLVPGTICTALFVVEGNLWDARSDRLYSTQTAEGYAQVTGPLMLLEDQVVFDLAKQSGLAALGRKVSDEFARQKENSPAPNNQLW